MGVFSNNEKMDKVSVSAACTDAMEEVNRRREKRHNIVLFGVPESTSGNDSDINVCDQTKLIDIHKALNVPTPTSYDSIKRLGRPRGDKKPRPIVVKFNEQDYKLRISLLQKSKT